MKQDAARWEHVVREPLSYVIFLRKQSVSQQSTVLVHKRLGVSVDADQKLNNVTLANKVTNRESA